MQQATSTKYGKEFLRRISSVCSYKAKVTRNKILLNNLMAVRVSKLREEKCRREKVDDRSTRTPLTLTFFFAERKFHRSSLLYNSLHSYIL